MLEPFDIINSPYTDLNGHLKTKANGSIECGLFLVVSINRDNTVTACKITSNKNNGDHYYNMMIDQISHLFLETNSYIQCDKIHILNVACCKKLGALHMTKRRQFIKIYKSAFSNTLKYLESYAPRYSSPNFLRHTRGRHY